jgi:cytoskeletal protein CcmA (bactofilin family)
LSFSGSVRIDGEFSGQALGGQLLVVGDGARVQGELRAHRVVILGGSVRADISATDGIELYVPAQVSGDLRAPEIHLDRGVRFQGTCDLTELPHLDADESRGD